MRDIPPEPKLENEASDLYVRELADPNQLYVPDKDGKPGALIKPNAKMEVSAYWSGKYRQIGIIMLVSMGILMLIILAESDILQIAWDGLLQGASGLFWGIVGFFS